MFPKSTFALIYIFLALSFVLAVQTARHFTNLASAQANLTLDLADIIVCDEPIIIGNAFDDTKDLLDAIFQEYRLSQSFLEIAFNNVLSQISVLTSKSNPEEVCDYNQCQARVKDQGPDASLKISFLGKVKKLFGIHVPICVEQDCVGEPCADLSLQINELEGLRDSFKKSQERVSRLLLGKTDFITYDLLYAGLPLKDKPTEKISKAEKILREIDLVRGWYTPSVGLRRSCVMTKAERMKAELGEVSEVWSMPCTLAREDNLYWPRPWSEFCVSECQDENSKECRDCLGDSSKIKGILSDNFLSSSILAKINYKIYGDSACDTCCKKECKVEEGLTQKCVECLCRDWQGDEEWKEEQCLAWLCGGSINNQVCCRDRGTSPYRLADQPFELLDAELDTAVTYREAYLLAKEVEARTNVRAAFLMGVFMQETNSGKNLGKCDCESVCTEADKKAFGFILKELGLQDDPPKVSCDATKQHGGAMGPVQFMPTTWWGSGTPPDDEDGYENGYKKKVEAMLSRSPASPWRIVDAFFGAGILLKDNGASLQNEASERTAACKYFSGGIDCSSGANKDYVDGVMAYTVEFQNMIDKGCFEEPPEDTCR